MPRIFISYRRSDTTAIARQLAQCLRGRFGPECVFHDLETIIPGQPFDRLMLDRLQQADVVVALIGVHWHRSDATGAAGASETPDWVHVELQAALACGTRIVPVLVGQVARMPAADDLPPSLGDFCRLNATTLDDGRGFDNDVARLMDDLERLLGTHAGNQLDFRSQVTPPTLPNRPTGVLVDRHYSYLLGTFSAEQPQQRNRQNQQKYVELFDMLARAVLFFDCLHIEQSYASSIAWTLDRQDSKAFADVFRTFTFDSLPMSALNRALLAEVIEADLRDPHYNHEIDRYYEGRPLAGNNRRELVAYINNVIFASFLQGWSILAWAPRARLFSYKLSRLNRFWSAAQPLDVARDAIDVVIPEFSPATIHDLNQLRLDPTIVDFRESIWRITLLAMASGSPDTKALVWEEFRSASRALTSEFRSAARKTMPLLTAGASPLPINAEIPITPEMETSLAKKPYRWLLFLHGAADVPTR